MKKKQPVTKPKKEEAAVTLKDLIHPDLVKQLKAQQENLKLAEEKRKEEEEKRKREERRLREKNKSFEELLQDSEMDWRKFK